jgi:tRNA (mo5U34)-methyltransferase
MVERIGLPASLGGLSVLDIGAWDGFFSFEAERRGARRVVAYDLAPADTFGFATAKAALGSRVEYVQGSVYELTRAIVGTFDVVLFLGVLYHLRYPLLALDRIREVCEGYMLLETQYLDECFVLADGRRVTLERIDPRLVDIPLYRFYRSDELHPGDFSNWFSPNRRAIEDGLWTAGFEPVYQDAWGDRIAYRARRLHGVPEYLQESYEGMRFVTQPDGALSVIPRRTTPAVPPRPASPAHEWLRRLRLRLRRWLA